MQDNSDQMPTLFALDREKLLYPEEKFNPIFSEQTESDMLGTVEGDSKQKSNRRNWSTAAENYFYELWGRDNWKLTVSGKNTLTFTQWSDELNERFGMDFKPQEIQSKVNQTRIKFRQVVKQRVSGNDTGRWKKFDLIQKILRNQYRAAADEVIPLAALEKNRDKPILDQFDTFRTDDVTGNVVDSNDQRQLSSIKYQRRGNNIKVFSNGNNSVVMYSSGENNIDNSMNGDNEQLLLSNGNNGGNSRQQHQQQQQQQQEVQQQQEEDYYVTAGANNGVDHLLQEQAEMNIPTNSSPHQSYVSNLADNDISLNNNNTVNTGHEDQTTLYKTALNNSQMPFISTPHLQNLQPNANASNLSVIRRSSDYQKNYELSLLAQNIEPLPISQMPCATIKREAAQPLQVDHMSLPTNTIERIQFGVQLTKEIDAVTGQPIKKPLYVSPAQMMKYKVHQRKMHTATKLQQPQPPQQQSLLPQLQPQETQLPETQLQQQKQVRVTFAPQLHKIVQDEQPTTSSAASVVASASASGVNAANPTKEQKDDTHKRKKMKMMSEIELQYLMEVRKRNELLADQKKLYVRMMNIEEKKVSLMQEFFPKCVQLHEQLIKQVMTSTNHKTTESSSLKSKVPHKPKPNKNTDDDDNQTT